MGKTTGFMDYTRKTSTDVPPLERMENFDEFHIWLSREEQQPQAARCMDCGVPFCQAGMMIGGMASGCPQVPHLGLPQAPHRPHLPLLHQ